MISLETRAARLHCNLSGLVREKSKRREKAAMVNFSAISLWLPISDPLFYIGNCIGEVIY